VQAISGENVMPCHRRFEIIGEKGLQDLQGKGMVKVMYKWKLDYDLCEHCLYGKHNQVKFASGATREKCILELIRNDVLGPVPIP